MVLVVDVMELESELAELSSLPYRVAVPRLPLLASLSSWLHCALRTCCRAEPSVLQYLEQMCMWAANELMMILMSPITLSERFSCSEQLYL